MKKILCPSMMCADYGNLQNEVEALNDAQIDIFHCDVMDGQYVPNMTMGLMDIKTIKKYSNKMVDCHLMIENPGNKVDWFIDAGADLIYIHPESERYVIKTLMHIKQRGAFAGIAVNPDTSIEVIKEMLPMCDCVMVMTVNPGFAGQKFIEFTKNKIEKLITLKEHFHYKVMIDGACSPAVIKEMSEMGCDGFILGTSALFKDNKNYKETIQQLKML